jgi:dTDP-4-amino-4,6-dideoxygalactose transaminase
MSVNSSRGAARGAVSAPFLKFAGPELDDATIAGVAEVLASGQLTSGPWVARFEAELSAFFGGRHVRVVTSATAAIELALALAGMSRGDEVITPTQTFFTAMNMIVRAGARPVFVDCDLITRNLDLAAVEAAITSRTRAILPTWWPGSLPDLDALHDLARRRGLRVIEDAALVMGSQWHGRRVGAFGDLATFSFHPNKNMTAIEGGALVTSDAGEAARIEALRFHGIRALPDRTRDVAEAGGKFNLPDVNARIGVAQLARLPDFLARRRALAERYFARFPRDLGCVLPPEPRAGDGQSWNMWSVLLPLERMTIDRKSYRDALAARGIGSGVSYEASHLTSLGRSLGGREGQFPVSERIARETVTLPLHTRMTDADVDRVCDACADILRSHRR